MVEFYTGRYPPLALVANTQSPRCSRAASRRISFPIGVDRFEVAMYGIIGTVEPLTVLASIEFSHVVTAILVSGTGFVLITLVWREVYYAVNPDKRPLKRKRRKE